eukprot:CAMPEP_0184865668 /NCGR_PEP_ID=MMETSP0580-20130426/18787_1 /TAXON_ID=1118495 /ORGANISM="Dactyliosolen fragilissimus" /LENGTH=317 /DNA_ID=CAMNT_0027364957 /DNA_START=68 /DNA_END=1021 /DNA_ORIENTATION=-
MEMHSETQIISEEAVKPITNSTVENNKRSRKHRVSLYLPLCILLCHDAITKMGVISEIPTCSGFTSPITTTTTTTSVNNIAASRQKKTLHNTRFFEKRALSLSSNSMELRLSKYQYSAKDKGRQYRTSIHHQNHNLRYPHTRRQSYLFPKVSSHVIANSGSTILQMVPPSIAKSGGKSILTKEEFQEKVLSSDESIPPILVFFSAPWCGPCRLSIPVVKEIVKMFGSSSSIDGEAKNGPVMDNDQDTKLLEVVDVCTDDLPEVAEDSGVVSIPTIQLYYRGELKDTIVGCVAKNVLASAVKKFLEDIGYKVEDIDSL